MWPRSSAGADAAREHGDLRGPSGAPDPTHPLQLAAKAFARSALAAHHLDARCQLDDDLGRRVIDVTGRGNRRADASLDGPNDLNDALASGTQRVHSVAGMDLGRRLCRVAIDADVPAITQLCRHRTRLDESDGAQPPVDPSLGCRTDFGHDAIVNAGQPIRWARDTMIPSGPRTYAMRHMSSY